VISNGRAGSSPALSTKASSFEEAFFVYIIDSFLNANLKVNVSFKIKYHLFEIWRLL
jgi:hypothetical protein